MKMADIVNQLHSPADALKTALVVGTTLSLINQSQVVFSGAFHIQDLLKIGMNFTVPFLVASYSQRVCIRKIQKISSTETHEN